MAREKGRLTIDYIRHGYRPKPSVQRHADDKRNEDWWFNPKFKATKE